MKDEMQTVFIDPHMFFIDDLSVLKQNMTFFYDVEKLCKNGIIRLVIDQSWNQHMSSRELFPFNIEISNVSAPNLRDELLKLQSSFRRIATTNFFVFDFPNTCDLDNIVINNESLDNSEFLKDEKYLDLAIDFRAPCKTLFKNISNIVLQGNLPNFLQIGCTVQVKCKCNVDIYQNCYTWTSPSSLFTESLKAKFELRKKIKSIPCENINSISASINGTHHNHVQKNNFKNLQELTYQNKKVLRLLIGFGLKQINFDKFKEKISRTVGTISIRQIIEQPYSDKVEAVLYSELEYTVDVYLYFPPKIGSILYSILGNQWDYKSVEQLATEFGVK